MRRALQWVLAISLIGASFSGTLTYRELITKTLAPCGAPSTQGPAILGLPACVYGLLMYSAIAVIAAIGLYHGRALTSDDGHNEAAPVAPAAGD